MAQQDTLSSVPWHQLFEISGVRLTESVLGACNVIADVPEDAAAKEAHDQGHHAVHEQ